MHKQVFDKIRADIDRVGWSAIAVFPVEEGGSEFCYTIGLTETLECPELIVYGLSPKVAHEVLHNIIYLMRTNGLVLSAGDKFHGVLEGYKVKVVEMEKPVHPLNAAIAMYGEDVSAFKVLWPDEEGIFPDEEGCHPMSRLAQTPVEVEEGE